MKIIMKVSVMAVFTFMLIAGGAIQSEAIVYEDGVLIPYAMYGESVDTAVGIMIFQDIPYTIYWNFLSADGVQLSHGSIAVVDDKWNYSFSLKNSDGNSHPDTIGYIIITFDNDGTLYTTEDRANLCANTVLLSLNDAAFIPVIPLDRGSGDYSSVNLDLNNLNADSITDLVFGHLKTSSGTDARYWIDPTYGAQTTVVLWSTQTPPASISAQIYTVNADPLTNVTLTASHSRLNTFDVATQVVGRPSGYEEGGIFFPQQEAEEDRYDRYIFSLISSTTFSAIQTLLGVDAQ